MGGITLRELDAKTITENVAEMCKEAAYYLPEDVVAALKKGRETEKSPAGQAVLDQILKNAEIAKTEDRPYCQDTGMVIVFLEVGQDLHITGGDLNDAVNAGIAKGYVDGYLRKSVVGEPLFNRVNTKDNTPGVIYTKIVPGDQLKITIEPKGAGSENKGGVRMLVPADGVEGVKKAVMDIVLHASMNPCPPTVLGIGIGGNMDRACVMSKIALTRAVGSHNPDPRYAKLEDELLELVNQTGIGPQLGGTTTCLGVNIEWGPTHIAMLPVAVTICCHAMRHKTRTL
jgi:fumarate hydratase subunit alpha